MCIYVSICSVHMYSTYVPTLDHTPVCAIAVHSSCTLAVSVPGSSLCIHVFPRVLVLRTLCVTALLSPVFSSSDVSSNSEELVSLIRPQNMYIHKCVCVCVCVCVCMRACVRVGVWVSVGVPVGGWVYSLHVP